MRPDLRVQWQLFAGIAGFVTVIDVVYWFVSYEPAGTTMLALAAGLAALVAGWLALQDRRGAAVADGDERGGADDAEVAHYLPAASAWPLAVGVAVAMTVNGLILGWPYATPGALLLAVAMAGFVAEGRRR